MKYLKYLIVTMILLSGSFSYGWSQDGDVVGNFYQTSFSGQRNMWVAEPAKHGQFQSNGISIEYRDPDTQVFGNDENTDRTISNGIYVAASGADENGNLVDSGKDIVSVMAVAVAKTTKWNTRGVSAFGGTAIQAGSGVATNEFWALQPEWSVAPATQLVGAFAVVAPNYEDCGDKQYFALSVNNSGTKQAQTAIYGNGNFNHCLDFSTIECAKSGIKMARGVPGSVIEYDNNTYTYFNGTAFVFVIRGEVVGTFPPRD